MPHQVKFDSRVSSDGILRFFIIGEGIITPGEEGTTTFNCFFPGKNKQGQLEIFTKLQQDGEMERRLQGMYTRFKKDECWYNTQKGTETFHLADGVWISIPGVKEKADLLGKIQTALG